jgi:hypothetical protein
MKPKSCPQNCSSSKSLILNTEPSSKYQYPSYRGGIGYDCEDRLSPYPLTADVDCDSEDDSQSLEVQS